MPKQDNSDYYLKQNKVNEAVKNENQQNIQEIISKQKVYPDESISNGYEMLDVRYKKLV